MTSQKIKETMKLKDVAHFYGLSKDTMTNYIKALQEVEKNGSLSHGRHNLIKALAFYYKYHVVEDEESLMEDLQTCAHYLAENIESLAKKEQFKEGYYEDLKNSLIKSALFLDENLTD